jgi:capsular exopolysaccharide synthesis family protein
VAERVGTTLDLDDVPDVAGSITDDSNVLRASVDAPDPESAAALANAYAGAFIEERRAQASANLLEVSDRLDDQVTDLDAEIERLKADRDAADQEVDASIAEREAQIVTLRTEIAALQEQLAQLNARAADLTTEERVGQETLAVQIETLQVQVDDANRDIDRLEATSDEVLEAELERLVTQRSLLLQRSSELDAASSIQSGGARVVRTAQPPSSPSNTQPISAVIMGLIAGLLLGMAAAFVRDYFDDSLTVPEDLDKLDNDLPLLAVVPVIPTSRGRSVGIVRPGSLGLEAFRSLRTNIDFLGMNDNRRVLELVSAQPDEGKTTVAANLAVALAQAGRSVVLVDADLRAPRLHRFFAVDTTVGLSGLLAGEPINSAVHQVAVNLSIIPAGGVPANPSELLASRRMEAIIDELRLRFEYIIIDSAPLLPVSDGLVVARHVDGVIVVAQSGRTRVGPLGQAIDALEQVSAPVVGIVLNRVSARAAAADGYTYGSEYGAKSALPPEQLAPPSNLPKVSGRNGHHPTPTEVPPRSGR